MQVKSFAVQFKEGSSEEGEERILYGYASVWDVVDAYGDRVLKGSFSKSLKERLSKNRIKAFFDHHSPVGVLLDAKEDETGLWTKAKIAKTQLGDDLLELVRLGALDSMSIGYDLVHGEGKNGPNKYGGLDLNEIKLFEVSYVGIPANEEATILALKSMSSEQAALRAELASLKAAVPEVKPTGASQFKASDSSGESIKPNQEASAAGKRALAWIEEGKGGESFTETGKARAWQMANQEALSMDIWKRVHSYFARHDVDSEAEGFNQGEDGYPSPGRVAYDAWGGEGAKKQAASIVEREDNVDSEKAASDIQTGTFVSWDSSGGSPDSDKPPIGKVVSIHTDGPVPDIDAKVEGTSEEPAARIQVNSYKDGDSASWEPTDTYVGHKVAILTAIDPPDQSDSDSGDGKSASGSTDLPLADEGTSWDGPAAMKALAKWASDDNGETSYSKMASGFFWSAPSPESQDDLKLPFAVPDGDNLKAVPAGVKAAASVMQGGRGGADIPESDVAGVKAKIAAYYKEWGDDPPWAGDGDKAAADMPTKEEVQAAVETIQALARGLEPSEDTPADDEPPSDDEKAMLAELRAIRNL